MSGVRHTTVTTTSSTSSGHKSNLDALLDDLQSSISHPGSNQNLNGNVVGYTEVRRTVTDGTPGGTSSQYHIEYLQPANTTTHIAESSNHSGGMPRGGYGGPNVSSYKEVTYKYQTGAGENYPKDAGGNGDVRLRQNISELDSLLDDLHTAQQNSFSDTSGAVPSRNVSAIEHGLLEPVTSTPQSHVLDERHYREEKRTRGRSSSPRRELVFTGGRSQDPSPIRHQTYAQDQSPMRQQQIYRYEKTTTSRSTAPQVQEIIAIDGSNPQMVQNRAYNYPEDPRHVITQRSPSPAGPVQQNTTYHYTTNTTGSLPHPPPPTQYVERVEKVTKYNTTGRSDYPERQEYAPPPRDYPDKRDYVPGRDYPERGGEYIREYHTERREYNNRDHPDRPDYGPGRDGHGRDYPENRETSPPRYPPGGKTTHIYQYNSNTSTRDSRPEVPRTPPPHRSPSPVSFQQPPLPNTSKTVVKTYHFDQPPRSPSPQPIQKFSPSDPSRTLTYNVSPPQHMVTSYKYTTTSTTTNRFPEEVPLLPRPFPNPSPSPTPEQQPPKKLDELMASFGDTDMQQYHTHETSVKRYDGPDGGQKPVDVKPAHPPAPEKMVESQIVERKGESKNVAGLPVYYPPGELFCKKEESVMQRQSAGGKYREKGKYEYEASSRSMTKETSGKAVVPICLPLCCGLPCVIM